MGPLGSAPSAGADILDVVVDPITQPLQQAVAGVADAVSVIDPTAGLDAVAGVDPAAVLAGLDLGGLVDPGAVGVGAVDLAGSLDVVPAGDVAGPSLSDPLALAASASSPDPLGAASRCRIRGGGFVGAWGVV